MAVKIRLARMGRKKAPIYRVVAADSRMPRNGRFIEKLGVYNPMTKDITLNAERYTYWKGVGAQETEAVAKIYKRFEKAEK